MMFPNCEFDSASFVSYDDVLFAFTTSDIDWLHVVDNFDVKGDALEILNQVDLANGCRSWGIGIWTIVKS